MRILITGATGFVGRVLCREAADAGYAVRAAVRSAGSLAMRPDCVVVGELGPQTDWRSALQDVDVVVHLAARVHVMNECAADPLAEFRRINTEATRRLAEQALAAGVKRFVFVSSIKVSGEASAPQQALHEGMAPAPQGPYAQSKADAEALLRELLHDSGMALTILRPVLMYGPGVRGNFARLAGAIARGWPLPLGGIENCRSLLSVWNFCSLILRCIEADVPGQQLFLAADDEALSTAQLCRRMALAQGRSARLVAVPSALLRLAACLLGKSAEAERLCGDLLVSNQAAREALGWRPPLSLDEGLRRSLAEDKKA